jgi:predicted O-methyltransferase YrrM
MGSVNYQYTNNWFEDGAKSVWDTFIPQLNPAKILEIGSYEGASACYLIEKLGNQKDLEIYCVDTWSGGQEHQAMGVNMAEVEARFLHNTDQAINAVSGHVDLVVHKNASDQVLAGLLANGRHGYFDLIYVDGSHQAPDVLCDAILGFRLLRNHGVMVFDDYLWSEHIPQKTDPISCPKAAIDAFTNLYCRKIRIIPAPLGQIYIQKVND